MNLNDTTAIADSLKYASGIRRCGASLWPVLACASGRSPPQGFLQPVLSIARCQKQPDSPSAPFAIPHEAGDCAVSDRPSREQRTPTTVSESSDTLPKSESARGMAEVRNAPPVVGGALFRSM